MIKKLLLFLLLVVIAGSGLVWMLSMNTRNTGSEATTSSQAKAAHDGRLPWKIDANDDQLTNVFSVQIGQDNLSTMIHSFKKVPELAFFVDENGGRVLEAYFSKLRFGILQASIMLEMDVEGVDLSKFANFDKQGKPMPSGKRKFALSKTGIINANQSRVWKLAYLPATDYSSEQIIQFFGQPVSKKMLSASAENWFYPDKGLAITYDKEGREVFYYSARADYEMLLQSVNVMVKEDG